MRISRIHAPVTVLGPGRRVGVWVQGCTLACPGCASRDTWDPAGGRAVAVPDLAAEIDDLGRGCVGLTVSGGEPLQQAEELADLIAQVRGRRREWDVLLFTGLAPDEWTGPQRAAVALADAVVAGRYRVDLPGTQPLRASANQQLILTGPRGRERYTDLCDQDGELQAVLDDRGLTMIGLPRVGDLPRMERALRARGVTLSEVSWRP